MRDIGASSVKTHTSAGSPARSPILITGESGTGKTLLAQAIAEASGRRPIVRATLGASDDLNTITSELFGHERGAFSGATAKRMGLAEYADGGTLILDEILNLQRGPMRSTLLLDFTQFGTYRPGSGTPPPEPEARARCASSRRPTAISARPSASGGSARTSTTASRR